MFKIIVCFIVFYFNCLGQIIKKPQIHFSPKKYICYHSDAPLIIDGNLNESAWNKTEWTDNFTDIEGSSKPIPRFRTRAKMLWDDNYFYIATELEEPDIWGTLKNHDDIIWNDNAIEFFIDPAASTHNYCEIEINALNTIWDLLLLKPYRDIKNAAISGWDIKDFRSSISIVGTLNNPSDKDKGWTLELAIPWGTFKELSEVDIPPKDQDQWRVNFLRVEWKTTLKQNNYQKQINQSTGKPDKPDYWVWSPQGIINMHYPEMWGYIQFSTEIVGSNKTNFVEKKEETAKWFLRQIYYLERNYFNKTGKFTSNLKELGVIEQSVPGYITPPAIECTSDMFEVFLQSEDKMTKIIIKDDGLIRNSKLK
jgi:hypothetical protein